MYLLAIVALSLLALAIITFAVRHFAKTQDEVPPYVADLSSSHLAMAARATVSTTPPTTAQVEQANAARARLKAIENEVAAKVKVPAIDLGNGQIPKDVNVVKPVAARKAPATKRRAKGTAKSKATRYRKGR